MSVAGSSQHGFTPKRTYLLALSARRAAVPLWSQAEEGFRSLPPPPHSLCPMRCPKHIRDHWAPTVTPRHSHCRATGTPGPTDGAE